MQELTHNQGAGTKLRIKVSGTNSQQGAGTKPGSRLHKNYSIKFLNVI
ncbi:hypothetical protein HYE00_03840 [Mycoplasmopsis bovis]|nr:hypothetical protein [Mycoplasmopsis bovis]QQH28806.1 hypothetical protein HYE00_03840 [Mycoplasmopsis bovis]